VSASRNWGQTLISDELENYADAVTSAWTEQLHAFEARARTELPYPRMISGPVVGRLLETLVFLGRPKLVLELGTYAGTSALAMAGGLPPGGRIVTCEISDEHADFAQAGIDESPYADRIEIRRGPGLEAIASIDEPIDFCFIDADKEGYVGYYDAVVPKLSEHGLIAADNTLRGGRVLEGDLMDDCNRHVASDPRTVQVLLTVRDGVTLVRRA
jgi:caffeoyl-CoA O-methyltransferase